MRALARARAPHFGCTLLLTVFDWAVGLFNMVVYLGSLLAPLGAILGRLGRLGGQQQLNLN